MSKIHPIHEHLLDRYPHLDRCKDDILNAFHLILDCFNNGGKLLVMGNGGSSADAEHICAELTKGCVLQRQLKESERDLFGGDVGILPQMLQNGLPAFSLGVSHSLISAFMNDVHPEFIFAQQIWVHAKENDVVLALSTSGNSRNVVAGIHTAKARNIKSIVLTGGNQNNRSSQLADVSICVPEYEVHKIQELHLPVYHYLCMAIEHEFFHEHKGSHYQQ